MTKSDLAGQSRPYRQLHRPARDFDSREDYLDHELTIMQPQRWRLNLPGRDYRFEWEDLVPALAGTIGISVMYSAVMSSWAAEFGLDSGFEPGEEGGCDACGVGGRVSSQLSERIRRVRTGEVVRLMHQSIEQHIGAGRPDGTQGEDREPSHADTVASTRRRQFGADFVASEPQPIC